MQMVLVSHVLIDAQVMIVQTWGSALAPAIRDLGHDGNKGN